MARTGRGAAILVLLLEGSGMAMDPQTIDVTGVSAVKVEDLGSVARGRSFFCEQNWGVVVAASTQGDGWSAYMLYRDHIVARDPWSIIEVNLQTEAVRRFDGQKCDCWFPTLMPDGCIYVFPEDSHSDPKKGYVARLDPKKGKLEIFGPGSPDSWNRCVSWGPGEFMYIGAYRMQCAMRFDPATGEFVNYGPQGPGRDVVKEGIYHVAADDHYVYTTMGGKPYYVYSCHKQTRKQTLLLTLEWPERAVLVRRPEGVFVIVDIQRNTPRLSEPTDEIVRYYRLENNTLTPIESLPPEPAVGLERSPGGIVKPEVHPKSPQCRADGTATLWYRPHGQAWKSVTFEAGGSPSYLFRLGTFEGKIIGASEDPYTVFLLDPATQQKTLLGNPYSLHTYAFQEHGGKAYFVGYSGAPIFQCDPRRAWTVQPPRPNSTNPAAASPEANPRRVVGFERQRRSYDIVLAGDGRMYVPCSANVESLPGGLLGWYDPKTGQSGGIREGFEHHSGVDAELAMDGRYVVVSTRPWPQSQTTDPYAYLLTYDSREHKVVGRVRPIDDCDEPGNLVEWKPGKIVGRIEQWPDGITKATWAPEKATSTFYLMDVQTQTCEVTLKLQRCSSGKLLRLPNGKIACTSFQTMLVIDPSDWSVEVVGRFDCAGAIRDWILLGDDLYVILDTRIVRLSNVGR